MPGMALSCLSCQVLTFFASRPAPPAVLPGINNCQHLVGLPNKRMTEWWWRNRGGAASIIY